ncbi:MAG: diguanylate cyclase [Candidatus Limnocylindrales bacterium]
MSIRLRLILVLVAMSTLAMTAMSTLFVSGNLLVATERDNAVQQQSVATAQRSLERALTDQAAAVRHYVLSADERALIPYRQGLDTERTAYATLEDDAILGESAHVAVAHVRVAAVAWRDGYVREALENVARGRAGDSRSAIALGTDKDLFDRVRVRLDAMDGHLAEPNPVWLDRTALISTVRMAMFGASLIGGVVALLITVRALGALVWKPLRVLVDTARQVERGGDVSFQLHRRDEVGDLAASLERMRQGIAEGRRTAAAMAEESSIVNFFTELTAFTESDVEVAKAMLTAIQELVSPESAVVHVSNRSRDRATPQAHLGDDPGRTLSLRGLEACPGVRRGSLYVTADVARPLAVRCAVQPATEGTVVCVPLTALGETVGAVHLSWTAKDALPVSMRATISRLAEHTALSIGNRRLVYALQGMANTDARTDLPNSRSFDERVEAALDRREPGRTDAILMLDLDHFKDFNDRYGHPAGDEALRAFAGVLRSTVRDTDLAARYGGEEFAVYLPDVDLSGAVEIAERIRASTEAAIVPIGPGATARISVSIGVAMSPLDGPDRITLLHAADQALYRAKQAGRNRVATTSSDGSDAADDRERDDDADDPGGRIFAIA